MPYDSNIIKILSTSYYIIKSINSVQHHLLPLPLVRTIFRHLFSSPFPVLFLPLYNFALLISPFSSPYPDDFPDSLRSPFSEEQVLFPLLTLTTFPIPFVLPSLKSSVHPSLMNSTWYRKRKRTLARSPVRRSSELMAGFFVFFFRLFSPHPMYEAARNSWLGKVFCFLEEVFFAFWVFCFLEEVFEEVIFGGRTTSTLLRTTSTLSLVKHLDEVSFTRI
jgi:hypothetical protein